MEQAFAWLGDLAKWVGALVPRWGVCRATHGGVKFVRGSRVLPVAPGLYWYWPAVTDVVVVPTARQSIDVPPQSLTTLDGVSVLVSTVLVYKIVDVVKALGQSWDVDDTVSEVGGAAAVGVVAQRTWAELMDALAGGRAAEDLAKSARTLLRPFGVQVLRARFTDCARCQVLRAVGDRGRNHVALPVPLE